MVTYTVHERENASGDITARADAIAFVKEGFAWLALFFPLLWLLYNRMWIVLAGFVGLITAMQFALAAAGLVDDVAAWATLALTLVFAFQANDLRRWSLARKGYRLDGPVIGPSRAACEADFFENWLAAQGGQSEAKPDRTIPATKTAQGANPQPGDQASNSADEVIGLFPDPKA